MGNVATAAAPAYNATAVLATPVPAPSETDIDGVKWRCEGDQCTGSADRKQSLDSYMKECRKVAEALGALSAYSAKGRDMSKRDVASCNKLAGKEG
jgi:hypothetical protein